MEKLTSKQQYEIAQICEDYQEERASGRWYIAYTGLNKVAKYIGGKYSDLTKTQKAIFRMDCVSQAQGYYSVKEWSEYLNI
jgi:hypothetical protein